MTRLVPSGTILPSDIQVNEPVTFYWLSHCLTGVSVTHSHEHPGLEIKREEKKEENKEEGCV